MPIAILTRRIPNQGQGHERAQVIDIRRDAVFRDAYGDAQGAVNLVYEAETSGPMSQHVVWLLPDQASIPVGVGASFLRTVTPEASTPLHVYVAVATPRILAEIGAPS